MAGPIHWVEARCSGFLQEIVLRLTSFEFMIIDLHNRYDEFY